MSSLFLADLFTDSLIDRRILFPGGSTTITGAYGVLVPDGVNVGTPPDVTTLLTSKYAGLQSFYGFAHIGYDGQLTGIDLANSNSVQYASKVGVAMIPPASGNSVFQSPGLAVTGTPTTGLFVYDSFFYVDQDVATGRFTRSYALPAAGDTDAVVSVSVSFNGSVYFPITPGSVFVIPAASQGSSFYVKFTRTGGTKRLFIGSWAVLYQ